MRHAWAAILGVSLMLGSDAKADPPVFSIPLPKRSPIVSDDTIRCSGLAQSMIEDAESASSIGHAASRVAVIAKGATDSLVLNLSGDKLTFLTKAAFDAGVAAGTVFQIVSRDERYLMAVAVLRSPQPMLNSLFIDRQQAIAVWTKARVNPLFSTVPDVATVYLVCK